MIKRKVKPPRKLKLKRPLKLSQWKRLYNRLYEDEDFDVYNIVFNNTGAGDFDGALFDALEGLCARFDCEINTLQTNFPDHVSYRVFLTYTDRTKKPINGWNYPRVSAVKTSRHLIQAATLAYLEICDQKKRWL